jgi:ABC-type lipoprotein release transport system permease subunit
MKIRHLVWAEIAHRKLNFLLALAAVTLAVAVSTTAVTLVGASRLETAARVKALDDEIRKITKNMGFNINILPADQNLADFYAADFAVKTMPYEFVQQLADSPDVVKVAHLRPALIRKIDWPEHKRQIVLMGVSGVVPQTHQNPKKPLAEPVPPGAMNLGGVLAQTLGLKEEDETQFHGKTFRVNKVYAPRGNKDDITVWVDLPAAQTLLELPGRINLIQALECNCASIDRLAEIQQEISGVLGQEVQVVELSTTAIARAKARNNVAAEGKTALAGLQRLANVLLPVAIVGAAIIVGLLSLANVHQRRTEIGILRAIGLRGRQVLAMFVGKSLLLGLIGAATGYLLGLAVAIGFAGGGDDSANISAAALFMPGLLLWVILAAPLLSVLAGWLPAMLAAQQDPATVLSEE